MATLRLTAVPLLFAFSLHPPAGFAERISIVNKTGSVAVRISHGDRLSISKSSSRAVVSTDVTIKRQAGLIEILCDPKDGAHVDLKLDIPIGLTMQIETVKGAISVEGMTAVTDLITESGDVKLAVPWQSTKLWAQVGPGEPRAFTPPEGFKFTTHVTGKKETHLWTAADRLSDRRVSFGFVRIHIHAAHPGKIELIDVGIPPDSPVKMPWQAVALVDEMLRPPDRTPKPVQSAPPNASAAVGAAESTAVFRSDVRVVALGVSVTNVNGQPIGGLKPEQFEVLEDGVPQQVSLVTSEEAPFNLALLLDLSGSTQQQRDKMQDAVKRFFDIARPEDRIGVYALAESFFMVLSPLSGDRARLEKVLNAVPAMSGGSPVYDTIVLAYAEDLRSRPNERNALIVISDGIDNQLAGEVTPSEVSFAKLLRAAEGWSALVYPIFLDPFDRVPPPRWAVRAKKQMAALAEATGGRQFVAHGLTDLEPVYPQVAQELRSVYSVTYSPKNQQFDGSWRKLQVRVKRDGAVVRTRAGYFAR